MAVPEITVEGLRIQRMEELTAPGVNDDNAIPEKLNLFSDSYSLDPVGFTYRGSSVYGIYCLVKCGQADIYPYLKASLIKGRDERQLLEVKHTPMWQDTKDPGYFAYRYTWPWHYEAWRKPGRYILELCIGYKQIPVTAGTKPVWLFKSCEETVPAGTTDNPHKFTFTINNYIPAQPFSVRERFRRRS